MNDEARIDPNHKEDFSVNLDWVRNASQTVASFDNGSNTTIIIQQFKDLLFKIWMCTPNAVGQTSFSLAMDKVKRPSSHYAWNEDNQSWNKDFKWNEMSVQGARSREWARYWYDVYLSYYDSGIIALLRPEVRKHLQKTIRSWLTRMHKGNFCHLRIDTTQHELYEKMTDDEFMKAYVDVEKMETV